MQADNALIQSQLSLLFPDADQRFHGSGSLSANFWVPNELQPDELSDYFARFQKQGTPDDAAAIAILHDVLVEMVAIERLLKGEAVGDVREMLEDARATLEDVLADDDALASLDFEDYYSTITVWEQIAVRTRSYGSRIGLVTVPRALGATPFVRTMSVSDYANDVTAELARLQGEAATGRRWRAAAMVAVYLLFLVSLGWCAG